MSKPLYRVTCVPWEHGLEVHIDGVGVTQTRNDYPDTVEDMARSYIALTLEVPPDSFEIAITGPETTAAILDALARVGRGEPTRDLGDFAQYLPADAQAEAAAEIAAASAEELPAVVAAWRSTAEVYADPQLLAALTRDSWEDGGPVPEPCGGELPCTDDCSHGQAFRQLVALDEELGVYDRPAPTREDWREARREVAEERAQAEPFADTDLDGPEGRETVLGADDYQRLLDALDQADRAHGQAMRARKRGGTEA